MLRGFVMPFHQGVGGCVLIFCHDSEKSSDELIRICNFDKLQLQVLTTKCM